MPKKSKNGSLIGFSLMLVLFMGVLFADYNQSGEFASTMSERVILIFAVMLVLGFLLAKEGHIKNENALGQLGFLVIIFMILMFDRADTGEGFGSMSSWLLGVNGILIVLFLLWNVKNLGKKNKKLM